MSLNIFLSWLKLFKYLQFVPFMRVLIRALGNSMAQVLSLSPCPCFFRVRSPSLVVFATLTRGYKVSRFDLTSIPYIDCI